MPDEPEFMPAVRWALRTRHVQLRIHAHLELVQDGFSLEEVLDAGAGGELLEDYPDRDEGHTILLLGGTSLGVPVHIVINAEAFLEDPESPLALVTVYEPAPPAWRDERTRGTIGGHDD